MSGHSGAAGRIDVVAVVGACVPERREYARLLAHRRGRLMLPAQRLAEEPQAVDHTVGLLRRVPDGRGMLVEYPLEIPATDVIAELADPAGETCLSELICVLDAAHLLSDLEGQECVRLPFGEGENGVPHDASRAELIVTQIELSSSVLLVNWEQLSHQRLSLVMALVSHLSPSARLDLMDSDALEGGSLEAEAAPAEPYSVEQTRAGWVCLLNQSFTPEFHSPEVGGLRYEQLRPFHPERLHELLTERMERGDFGLVLRSAGFCRLATRPHVTGRWDQVGARLSLAPLSFDHQMGQEDEMLAFGQDLAFIGLGLDADHLIRALDEAVLNDQELTAGPGAWAAFPDRFPEWRTIGG